MIIRVVLYLVFNYFKIKIYKYNIIKDNHLNI